MADESLNAIIEKVVGETVPQSVRQRVSAVQMHLASAASGAPSNISLEQTYIETAQGQRYFDERRFLPEGRVSHVSSYCDGTRCANVRFSPEQPDRQSMITIGRDFMNEADFGFRNAPEPLRYYHVGLFPLHEAIQHAERMGQERVIDRNCNVFHFRDVGPPSRKESLVYSLDEATSIPLKVAAYARSEQISAGAPNWLWEAKTLDSVDGRHYPLSSTYTSFGVSQDATGRWASAPRLTRSIEVKEISFDGAVAGSAFWPTFQPGVFVLDGVAKKKYQTPGGPQTNPATLSTAPPIRVEPEIGFWLPGIGLALSLAVLGVAAVLRVRAQCMATGSPGQFVAGQLVRLFPEPHDLVQSMLLTGRVPPPPRVGFQAGDTFLGASPLQM